MGQDVKCKSTKLANYGYILRSQQNSDFFIFVFSILNPNK